jgi:hypothetical protein
MTKAEVRNYVAKTVNDHPDLKDEITDLYILFLDEVEEGGSVEHEAELCIASVKDIVDEKLKKQGNG